MKRFKLEGDMIRFTLKKRLLLIANVGLWIVE